jgi:NADPH:quinone reductase-like Zn-dependent oxidoreductase
MKALVLQENPAEKLAILDVPKPTPKAGEVLVSVQYAALNHRDQWCRVNKYPNIRYPSILGSDACGIVAEVGEGVDNTWVGKRVILNPNVGWGNNLAYPDYNYTILGMPTDGTLADFVCLPAHRLVATPNHLTSEEAAAIPLAGLTAFRAVFTKGAVKAGQNVLVTGIGGGVAQFAMLFAKAQGAKVFVTSGDDAKLEKVKTLGADFGVNYKTQGWEKQLQKQVPLGFDAIIDGSGGEAFGVLAKMLALGGNMVVYGTTAGTPSPLNLPRLFFAQASIKGSTMGNDEEFLAMVQFIEKYQIKPIVSSVRPFAEVISAFDEMEAGKQFGKLVIAL